MVRPVYRTGVLTSHLELHDHGDVVVVVMFGEHDLSNAATLRTLLEGARRPSRSVVADPPGGLDSALPVAAGRERATAVARSGRLRQ
jgi:hypothetical protein